MNYTDYMVSGFFYKVGDYQNNLQFGLSPNKFYNPKTWIYPVTWSGRVGWKDVSLVQTTREEIDFSSLSYELKNAIPHIKGKIESAIMRLD